MKRNIFKFFIIFLTVSCINQKKYKAINDELYKDNSGNIFLKEDIHLLKDTTGKPVERYLDDVTFGEKVFKLKKFIDIKTFHKKTSRILSDTIKSNNKDIFEDKKYIYEFEDFPTKFPLITIYKK